MMKTAVIRMEGNAQQGVTRTRPATDAEDGGVRMDLNGMGRMEGTSRKAEHRTKWEGIVDPSGHVDLGASQVALVVKNLAANAGEVRDTGSIPGWRISPGGEHGNPVHYSCLENQRTEEPGGL